MGAAAGLLVGTLARLRSSEASRAAGPGSGDGADEEAGRGRWRDAWDDVLDGAAEGLASARDLVTRREALDAGALQARLDGMACSTECRVRLLGEGIVEVVGSCASEADARALLDELADQPGVEVVVNRVWTPSSSDPGGPTAPH